MGFMHGYDMGGWIWLMPVLTLVLFGGGIFYLANRVTGGSRDNESALDILKKRYARGELSKAEFEEMRREV